MSAKLEMRKTKFISGNKLTINDFQMAHCMWTYWVNPEADQFYPEKCKPIVMSKPVLVDYFMRLEKELKTVLETRKKSPW